MSCNEHQQQARESNVNGPENIEIDISCQEPDCGQRKQNRIERKMIGHGQHLDEAVHVPGRAGCSEHQPHQDAQHNESEYRKSTERVEFVKKQVVAGRLNARNMVGMGSADPA